MSRYYNPVTDVTESTVGRLLNIGHDHEMAIRELRTDEHLYVIVDNLLFKAVICVDSKQEYDYYYTQYYRGGYVTFELVALDEAAHQRAR